MMSPARRAGLHFRGRVSRVTSASTWDASAWRTGQAAALRIDPRHEGEVCAVFAGGERRIRVCWSNGWKSDHTASELVRP